MKDCCANLRNGYVIGDFKLCIIYDFKSTVFTSRLSDCPVAGKSLTGVDIAQNDGDDDDVLRLLIMKLQAGRVRLKLKLTRPFGECYNKSLWGILFSHSNWIYLQLILVVVLVAVVIVVVVVVVESCLSLLFRLTLRLSFMLQGRSQCICVSVRIKQLPQPVPAAVLQLQQP